MLDLDLDGLDDEFMEIDEKTMTDLHLSSAINLDQVEYLLTGKFDTYQIYIPGFLTKRWADITELGLGFNDKQIGLLIPTQQLLLRDSRRTVISQTVYKSILKIIGTALAQRKVNMPITYCWEDLSKADIKVDSLTVEMFRLVLKICCMVSEASRGGSHSFYKEVSIKGENAVGEFRKDRFNYRISANNAFCIIDDRVRKVSYYGTFESLLLIMDTLGQRLCLDIGCQVADIGKMVGVPDARVLRSVLRVGDAMLYHYGNNGYEFIGMFESLVVSTILKKNPDLITDPTEFFQNCRGEVEEMISEGIYQNDVLDLFDSMSRYLMELSNETLSNIFCIYRIWGHPRVNIKEGMKKVMEKGIATKRSSSAMADIVANQFKKMFLIEFYNKHQSYPPCIFHDETTYIAQCIRGGFPISSESSGYSIHDFQEITIGKLWELPETYDVCHILNDRAVSPTRSELHKSIREGKGTVHGAQRRGIVRWLMSDSIRCKEFLDNVDENGLSEDSLVIGMYEKEREIKIKARMFSLMSEEMRMYFVLTEEMISEHLLKYFPQITMKDPLHVQIKKLWNVSGISGAECIDPIINIDFEKWNLNMREEFTKPLFQQMDLLFGYSNLISRTHEMFENSLIYSCSGKYLPQVTSKGFKLDPPMCYTGHKGGFEGLRQKGWTVATVCLLSYIADKLRFKINLLGQGDNQVIRIYMPHSYWDNLQLTQEQKITSSKDLLNEYLQSMYNYFDEAGLPIKSRETWKSTRLYMYGKNMFLDGSSLPQWTKKLLRSYALSNEGTLTISGVIGTIATNMCAAANASEKPDIMYVLYLILSEWSLEFLFAYHPFTRKIIKPGEEIEFHIPSSSGRKRYSSGRINLRRLTATILLVPTSVGGSITIPLFGFIIRGFPDNASEGYCWLKLLKSVKSEFQDLFSSWYKFLCNETREFDMLIQSPWSLNHRKPPTPGLQSRETVREFILSGRFRSNSFISGMKSALRGFDRKEVSKKLVGQRINPLILNEIYNSFPQVYLDQILRRVENTRTIKKLALKLESRIPIVSKLMEIEDEFLGYLHWRGFQSKGEVFSDCATEHCRIARNVGWGCEIKGLTTPHPAEYLCDHVCDDFSDDCIGNDYIFVKIDQDGNFPPYLGSNVKTKVVSLQDVAIRSEPLVSTAAKLLRYSKWLNLGENANEVIQKNISVVCNTDIFHNIGHDAESFYTGCVEHRFNPSSASEGCFINYAPQVGRKIFISSDCMPQYGRGQINYTIHFQAMYCFMQYVASETEDCSFKHYHLCCDKCIIPVDDEVDDIGDMSSLLEKMYGNNREKLLQNTLGYLNKRVETFEDRIEPKNRSIPMILPINHNTLFIKDGVHLVLSCMAATMIMYAPRDIPDMIGANDLQTFPRIYSYKVSSRRILEYTADHLLVIKASRMLEEINSVRQFLLVKEKLVNQLMKVPLDKYKGLGSLLLGRTWDPDHGERPLLLNLGEFPEFPTSFLNSVRSELINLLESRCTIRKLNRCSQLPVLGISDKAIKICLVTKMYGTYECDSCFRNCIHWLRADEEFVDCPNNHMFKIKKKNSGVNIPMDLAVKLISTLPNTEDPMEVRTDEETDLSLFFKMNPSLIEDYGEEEDFKIKAEIKQFRRKLKILLPTTALYKWDHLLSFVGQRGFQNVLVFGDGTGYTSLAASRRFSSATIYPTALIEKKRLIPQDLMSLRPFASRRYTNVSGRLLEEVPDDILDDKWEMAFSRFFKNLDGQTLILSDVESIKGNNNRIVKKLFRTVSTICNDNPILICKITLRDWDISELGDEVYVSAFNNHHHKECFISNTSLGGLEDNIPKFYTVEEIRKIISTDLCQRAASSRDIQYFEAVEASKKISTHVVNRNFIPLNLDDLKLPACAMMYKILSYLSSNFKPPNMSRFHGDKRTMLDGTLFKIIRGVKMLMIMLYGHEIIEKEYFKRLHIIRAEKSFRYSGLRNLNLVYVEGQREIILCKKERQAATVLRQDWVELHQNEMFPEVPESILRLYTEEIIPGKLVFRELSN
ncbi:TPA_asm: L [Brassica rapa virus 1]|uniref:RNA-directed RNA polymerase n=1 Tax=Brassica rapa virus 1 TaxID=2793725 RepID=A0A8D9PGT2_9RHAB|nr:L [Brassica rapa virus 1] [Brassica rapa virus 1]DAF42356.1 TPA_asm: L [Brassica rapa virus 1]